MNHSDVSIEVTEIVYITAEAIVGLITVIGNSLVLGAIVKSRRLHTITNVFVGNLAIADIVVGLLVAPCAALSFMGIPTNFYGCIFINCLILMFTNVSILMLLSVAFERFLAIKEPFLYHRLLSVRRAIYVNICVWVVGFILGLLPMYGWHGTYLEEKGCRFTDVITYQYMVYFQFFGLVLIPLFIMLCIYIYILIIVRKHLRQTSALHNRFQPNGDTTDGFHKDVRAAKMFALVILTFAIFWFPVNIFNCVSLYCGSECYFPNQALLVAVVMSHANSSINPFLYATSNSRIKGAIKELFGIKLSPDERSSTDHNLMRHAPNGSPSPRDNNVVPILNGNPSSNFKDDSNPFIISHNGFRPDTDKLTSMDNSKNEDEDYQIMLNSINHNRTRQEASNNSNSQSPNHNPHPSLIPLSVSTTTDKLPGYNIVISKHQQNTTQDYMQTRHFGSQEEAFRLSITPPSSPLSDSLSHYRDTDIHSHQYGQFSVDLTNAESLTEKGHRNDYQLSRNTVDGSNIPDNSELENRVSFELEQTVVGNIQADEQRCQRKHLWCWISSDQDAQNDLGLTDDSLSVCKCQKRNGSAGSGDVFMMNRRNVNRSVDTTFSSISTTSNQPSQSPTSVEPDLGFGDKTTNQKNWQEQLNTNTVLKSYGQMNEHGVIHIDTIEHTQL